MKRVLFMVGLMGLAASGAFVPAPYGDVTLKGPVGVRLETMLKNHVFATDTVEKGPFTLALRIPAWSKHTSGRVAPQRALIEVS